MTLQYRLLDISRDCVLTFRNSSLLVRLEQCRHSGWWEGRTHWRRLANLARISCSHTVGWLVGHPMRGGKLLNWELDYCPQMPRSRSWCCICWLFFSCARIGFLSGSKYLCQYDFLLVTVHMLNVLISVYSNKEGLIGTPNDNKFLLTPPWGCQ